ncbi:MAG: glycosyltransferase family 4 protein [bacterium]
MNRPLRVLLVSAAYRPYPSGVSEHTYNLALNLKKTGQEVFILTTKFPQFEHLSDKEQNETPVYRLGRAILIPLNRSYATLPVGLTLPLQMAHLFSTHQFDIVHCHGVFWPEISYWALRYSRSINLITFLTAGFRLHTFGRKLFQLVFRQQIRKIHGRIAISQRARAAIEPYIPGEYRIIPSGIDLNHFHPTDYRQRQNRDPTILFLGRLDKRKGIDVLLQALPLIKKSIPNIRLTVVGTGVMEQRCHQLIQHLGLSQVVQMHGPVHHKDIPLYYQNCDVYCSPALGGETQGVVLLEALACGIPVVASDIPGYDETIKNGVDGILFPPGDIKALSESLIQLISNDELKNKLIRNGLEKVKHYAWPVITQKTLNYYFELVKNGIKASHNKANC